MRFYLALSVAIYIYMYIIYICHMAALVKIFLHLSFYVVGRLMSLMMPEEIETMEIHISSVSPDAASLLDIIR